MKLIVMIPCYNEENTLPLVINSIPQAIEGIDKIEVMVIDDGCTDRTVEVARKLGVQHIIRFKQNRGLAAAFEAGLNAALSSGADIIVNTDGDNQYPQQDIPRLIRPILEGKADIIIADRQTGKVRHFTLAKKALQALGSWTVRHLSKTNVPDAPSGFRAYSRDAALRMNIVTDFSYVIETIIQAGKKGLVVDSIPIVTNPKTRESRLFRSIWQHVKKSSTAIVRVYTMYEPLKVFAYAGAVIFSAGLILVLRFLYYALFIEGGSGGHVQSLILAAVLLIMGFQIFLIGLLADLVGINRKLLEDALLRLKELEHRRKEK